MEYFREMLGLVQNNLSQILSMANLTITLVDVIEILIISFLFYNVLLWIKSTRAWNLFKGIMVILLFVLLAAFFQMSTILWIAENTLNVGLIALVIIFQPELRNALEDIGGKNILGSIFVFNKTAGEKFSNHTIDELVKFGQIYAGDLDYVFSDSAAAALYDRIAGVAAQGEAVSITNVIELVDRAISKSNKFFRKLSGKKRYDENNCIILHEKDFR
jgi:hypothetical protein